MAGAEARVILEDKVILDFEGLFSAANKENKPPEESVQPVEQLLEQREYKDTIEDKSLLHGKETAHSGTDTDAPAISLLRKAEQEATERERSLEICREYQHNIRVAGSLRTDILKGVRAGENAYSLFLKAVKAISLIASDRLFYTQIEADIKTIYGYGLGEKVPLQIELEEVKTRLQRLTEAEEREQEHDSKQRIQVAIKRHKNKIEELEEQISRAN